MKTPKFSITNKTKINPSISGLIFRKIKDEILGKEYELSVAFENSKAMRKLNRTYRDKDYATDILSFPISKTEGEIIICEKIANKKSKLHSREPENFLYFLHLCQKK